MLFGIPDAVQQEANAIEQTRTKTGHKQCADGSAGHGTVNNSGDARRDQQRNGAGRRDQARRKALGVALLDHFRIRQTTNRKYRCRRRAGDRTEEHTGNFRGDSHAAALVSNHAACPVQNSAGDTTGFHDVGRQNKERDRHQRELVNAADHTLNNDHQREIRKACNCDERGQAERNEDRYAQNEKDQQGNKQCSYHVFASLQLIEINVALFIQDQRAVVRIAEIVNTGHQEPDRHQQAAKRHADIKRSTWASALRCFSGRSG